MSLLKEAMKEIIKDELQLKDTIAIPKTESRGYKIVVLQRGWIAVGEYFSNGTECRLENASVIRKWGTKNGLGEIALNGPTSETILDKSGTIRFHLGAEVCRLDCKTSNWN